MEKERIILGIDPGLAHTGWGIILQQGPRLSCQAYGCVATDASQPLAVRLAKIHGQIEAVIDRYHPSCLGIETVWFGQNVTAAFATGQARGAALVACAQAGVDVGEYSPKQIKLAVVGEGSAGKEQVQYMVKQILSLNEVPHPDHAADALAAAICYTTHQSVLSGAGVAQATKSLERVIEQHEMREMHELHEARERHTQRELHEHPELRDLRAQKTGEKRLA